WCGWCGVDRRRVPEKFVRPRDEVLPVRTVGVAAVVLAPGQVAVEQANTDRWHFLLRVVVRDAQILRAEQAKHRLRRDGRHVAALLIEPPGVAAFGHAVADEGRARRAERDQLVSVDRDVAGVPAAERGRGRAVLQEVAGHPVILARAGEILDGFAEVPAMQLGAAL